MSLFFETIRIEEGRAWNLAYHNRRCNRTRAHFFPEERALDLADYIVPPITPGIFRCKIFYDRKIREVTYHPYRPRQIRSFKLLVANISYGYKYADRGEIERLTARKGACDEILITHEGWLQDTSIANIALYDGLRWITPRKPLLEGTQRARLLDQQIIIEKDVKIEDLKKAAGFAVMNAMVGFLRIDHATFAFQESRC